MLTGVVYPKKHLPFFAFLYFVVVSCPSNYQKNECMYYGTYGVYTPVLFASLVHTSSNSSNFISIKFYKTWKYDLCNSTDVQQYMHTHEDFHMNTIYQ